VDAAEEQDPVAVARELHRVHQRPRVQRLDRGRAGETPGVVQTGSLRALGVDVVGVLGAVEGVVLGRLPPQPRLLARAPDEDDPAVEPDQAPVHRGVDRDVVPEVFELAGHALRALGGRGARAARVDGGGVIF